MPQHDVSSASCHATCFRSAAHVRTRELLERWSLLPHLLALAASAGVGGAAAAAMNSSSSSSSGTGELSGLELVARCVQRALAAACAQVVGGPGAPSLLMAPASSSPTAAGAAAAGAWDWGVYVRQLCGELGWGGAALAGNGQAAAAAAPAGLKTVAGAGGQAGRLGANLDPSSTAPGQWGSTLAGGGAAAAVGCAQEAVRAGGGVSAGVGLVGVGQWQRMSTWAAAFGRQQQC